MTKRIFLLAVTLLVGALPASAKHHHHSAAASPTPDEAEDTSGGAP